MNRYVSMESIKSLKDCVQANIFKHHVNNKILTHDLKTNYQKIQQLCESKSITIEINEQLNKQVEKYHINHLLLTASIKQEEMIFNRILDKFELENSNKYFNDEKSQYNVEQEFKLAIKYFPNYVENNNCAQDLIKFLIRVHRNELLKYIFEYKINIPVDIQYNKYVDALQYENESAIPILLENKFNFIKLKKYADTSESVIQYCMNKNKHDLLYLFMIHFNKIKKYYKLDNICYQEDEVTIINYFIIKNNKSFIDNLPLLNNVINNIDVVTGYSCLMISCLYSKIDLVRFFIDNGANVNLKNDKGVSAIMCASGKLYNYISEQVEEDIITLLLENGANINERDNEGVTPIMYAARSGSNNIVEFLKYKGADFKMKDNMNRCIYYYLNEHLHTKLQERINRFENEEPKLVNGVNMNDYNIDHNNYTEEELNIISNVINSDDFQDNSDDDFQDNSDDDF